MERSSLAARKVGAHAQLPKLLILGRLEFGVIAGFFGLLIDLASAGTALASVGVSGDGPGSEPGLAWRRSMWWTVLHFVGAGLVAWLAPGR